MMRVNLKSYRRIIMGLFATYSVFTCGATQAVEIDDTYTITITLTSFSGNTYSNPAANGLYCGNGGAGDPVIGETEVLNERFVLSDTLQTAIWYYYKDDGAFISAPGTFLNNVINIIEDYPLEEVTSPGSTVRYFSKHDSELTATFDPNTNEMNGVFVEDYITSWNMDSTTAVCRIIYSITAVPQNNAGMPDADEDGVIDSQDNCSAISNSAQRDTDGDNYGNRCDPDFDNNMIVNAGDLAYLKSMFFTTDPETDLNGDGAVNAGDLAILKTFFFKAPGPNAVVAPPPGCDYETPWNDVLDEPAQYDSFIDFETVVSDCGIVPIVEADIMNTIWVDSFMRADVHHTETVVFNDDFTMDYTSVTVPGGEISHTASWTVSNNMIFISVSGDYIDVIALKPGGGQARYSEDTGWASVPDITTLDGTKEGVIWNGNLVKQ